MNKKIKLAENEGPLTRADVFEVVTEVVNAAIAASEERMMRRMDLGFERIDERFEQVDRRFENVYGRFDKVAEDMEYHHQGIMSGFVRVHEDSGAVCDRLDSHIGQNATIFSKMDQRVVKLEDHVAKLRIRPA